MSFEILRAELDKQLSERHDEIKQFIQKGNDEIKNAKSISIETKNALEAQLIQSKELADRLLSLEQKNTYQAEPQHSQTSLGQRFIKSQDCLLGLKQGSNRIRYEVKESLFDTPSDRLRSSATRTPEIIGPAEHNLTVRDLLGYGQTSSSSIEYVHETLFDSHIATQAKEGDALPQSAFKFGLASAPVATIGTWVPMPAQMLDDIPMLASYIDTRLIYALRLEEDKKLLTGTGEDNDIIGLIKKQTPYKRGGGSKIDVIRKAIGQVQESAYSPTGVILNPLDWEEIELSKGTEGHYLIVNSVVDGAAQKIWRLPVVMTHHMPAGNFQVGAYKLAAQFWDRQEAMIEISREDKDNFTKKMVTILASERAALTVYRPAAIVGGAFPSESIKASKAN
jgi:HK97 family phage major capsid protein